MAGKTGLVIGGTSGLGLSLAKRLHENGYDIIITGRSDRSNSPELSFKRLDLSAKPIADELTQFTNDLPKIDTLVLAAGYAQIGTLTALSEDEINDMLQVGLIAPTLLLRRILKQQETIENLITITSTAQFTPRADEPVYGSIKSGLAMLSNSMAESDLVKHTLVAAPGGMRTPFWDKDGRDTSQMLDPEWVADSIYNEFKANDYSYKFIKMFRKANPSVDIAEQRPPKP